MDRDTLLSRVRTLRHDRLSIRAIASEMRLKKGQVERALKALARYPDRAVTLGDPPRLGIAPFVCREREMSQLHTALDTALARRRKSGIVRCRLSGLRIISEGLTAGAAPHLKDHHIANGRDACPQVGAGDLR